MQLGVRAMAIGVAMLVFAGAAPAASGALLPGLGGSATEGEDDPFACGGEAPTVTNCITKTVPYVAGMSHGFEWGVESSPYTGTLVSKVTHANGAHTVTCNLQDGILLGGVCTGSGTWPASLASFAHECWSYDLNTTTLGGSGSWLCHVHST
jgi:hypothetical protein